MRLMPIKPDELIAAKPLPWPLYDSSGNVVLKAGFIPETDEQIKSLLASGLNRDHDAKSDKPEKSNSASETSGNLPLDQVKLNIGDSIQLQAQSETDNSRYYVTLVGYLVGQSVIVTTPTLDGNLLLMRDGQSFVVRLFSGKSAYAFTALIKKVTNSPFPHLHLTYPKEVRGIVVRGSARAQANIICHATVEGGAGIACVARDISMGGALLAAKEQMGSTGEKMLLKLRVIVSEVEHLLTLSCVIRSINVSMTSGSNAPSIQHGVSFEDPSAQDRLVITALLYQNVVNSADDA